MNYPYLNDKNFLKEIDSLQYSEQVVRIELLDWQENPVSEIQGKILSGGVNVDGSSGMRRTANLSFVVDNNETNLFNTRSIISPNKKIALSLGVKNNTDKYQEYPIIWHPLGVYIISRPSVSYTEQITISIQLMDKMCLLNGECGGKFTNPTVLDTKDTLDEKGEWVTKKTPLYQLILEMVNHVGEIPINKIIINDVPDRIRKVVAWSSPKDLYIYKKVGDTGVIQYLPTYDESIAKQGQSYTKYSNGDDVGYEFTDFVFPTELIANIGQSVSEMLDKIIDFFGNYEYFFDVYGNFIFREKKNYLNKRKSSEIISNFNNQNYIVDYTNMLSSYALDNGRLIVGYSDSPQIDGIKNDFTVWGVRKNGDLQTPLRYRLVIDKKPKVGNKYQVVIYTDNFGVKRAKAVRSFPSKENFPNPGLINIYYQDSGNGDIYIWDTTTSSYLEQSVVIQNIITEDWRIELYLSILQSQVLGTQQPLYASEILQEIPILYDIQTQKIKDIYMTNPSSINYYFDMLDTNTSVGDYSIENIGRRAVAIKDEKINCVFAPEIPDLAILNLGDKDITLKRAEAERKGQDYIQIPEEMYLNTIIGGRSNSAFNKIKELLFESTTNMSPLNISSVSIYSLDVNNRITINDNINNIYGDFMIDSFNLDLDIGNNMSINTHRIVDRL